MKRTHFKGWTLIEFERPSFWIIPGIALVLASIIYYTFSIINGIDTVHVLITAVILVPIAILTALWYCIDPDRESIIVFIAFVSIVIPPGIVAGVARNFGLPWSIWPMLINGVLLVAVFGLITSFVDTVTVVLLVRAKKTAPVSVPRPPVQDEMMVARCESCDELILDRAPRFCPKCGSPFPRIEIDVLKARLDSVKQVTEATLSARNADLFSAITSKAMAIASWAATHETFVEKIDTKNLDWCVRNGGIGFRFEEIGPGWIGLLAEPSGIFMRFKLKTGYSARTDSWYTSGNIAVPSGTIDSRDPVSFFWHEERDTITNDACRNALLDAVGLARSDPDVLVKPHVTAFLEKMNAIIDNFPDDVRRAARTFTHTFSETRSMMERAIKQEQDATTHIITSRGEITTTIELP